jgi:hypothetical protein
MRYGPMLKRLGLRVTALVHGRRRSRAGLLLTGRSYIEPDQEWRLGQSYLGMSGFAVFVLGLAYLGIAHADTPMRGHRHVLGPWSQLGLDLKILLPIMVVCHLAAMASCVRAVLVWQEINAQDRDDIGE